MGGRNLRVPPCFVPCRAVPPWGGGGGKEALCHGTPTARCAGVPVGVTNSPEPASTACDARLGPVREEMGANIQQLAL